MKTLIDHRIAGRVCVEILKRNIIFPAVMFFVMYPLYPFGALGNFLFFWVPAGVVFIVYTSLRLRRANLHLAGSPQVLAIYRQMSDAQKVQAIVNDAWNGEAHN